MKTRKMMSTLALVLTLTFPVMGLAEVVVAPAPEPYGAAALAEGKTYTVEEMLTYAIQDEYLAQGEYKAIIAVYRNNKPFSSIVKSEATHIARLVTLFTAYNIPVPEDKSALYTAVPASLQVAYETGVTAEVHNIAMYESFLKQENLPEDLKLVFEALKKASENHLEAFRNNADKNGNGQGNSGSSNRNGWGKGN